MTPTLQILRDLPEEQIHPLFHAAEAEGFRFGNSPQAARLYERLGFHPVVDLADCTHVLAWPSRQR